jgi:hypothetical protein
MRKCSPPTPGDKHAEFVPHYALDVKQPVAAVIAFADNLARME